MRTAALAALATVARVDPTAIVPRAMAHAHTLVAACEAENISGEDMAIFRTEPGQLYTDGTRSVSDPRGHRQKDGCLSCLYASAILDRSSAFVYVCARVLVYVRMCG
jgi:hypothetical protein